MSKVKSKKMAWYAFIYNECPSCRGPLYYSGPKDRPQVRCRDCDKTYDYNVYLKTGKERARTAKVVFEPIPKAFLGFKKPVPAQPTLFESTLQTDLLEKFRTEEKFAFREWMRDMYESGIKRIDDFYDKKLNK